MADFLIYKETALPGTLTAHSIYLIAPAARPDYVEVYVTAADPATVKRVINSVDVQAMINASLSGINALQVVTDIAARNALTLTANTQVLVLDATGDATVASGAATYVWQQATSTWHKISEAESLDVQLTWAAITGGPTSTPAQIDAAVSASHTHANKTELDKVGQNADGNFTYNGALPVIGWTSSAW
jgi:hypothetical protein